ncbi:hypothetical protein FRC09_017967 [Ceratobasidium sp. 395]|nr:hypothetical protein FRC09_017967 [Ceratobasidium sp. 395]
MILHWTGEFKELDAGTGAYKIDTETWNKIGKLTAKATKTIPGFFVGTLPDIAKDGNLYKAEGHGFWIQYLAPILLADRLPEPYYGSLQWSITRTEIDELEQMIFRWVTQYEDLYFQHDEERLPACPLTIHALLHIPHYLRRTGPPWASWCFVMERFGNHVLPAVKNRVRPYDHMDNFVQRRSQMQVVSRIHDLPFLRKTRVNVRYENGVEVTSRETTYKDFPGVVLGAPVTKQVALTVPLLNKFSRYFGVFHEGLTARQLHERIEPASVIRYGRIRLVPDSDRMRTASLIDNDPVARDNSYIKYDLLPDRNARYMNRADVPERQTQYGRLLDIYHLMFREDDGTQHRYVLARVLECNTGGLDAADPANPLVTFDMARMLRNSPIMINVSAIIAAVGIVNLSGNRWAILDRSRGCARPQFIDEDGNIEHEPDAE